MIRHLCINEAATLNKAIQLYKHFNVKYLHMSKWSG